MGIGGISIWQLLIILAIVIMLFGTKRLRTLGSDLGSAVKGFRNSMQDEGKNDKPAEEAAAESDEASSEKNGSRSAMFDIGFAELLIIGGVSLLVIGPERLPGAVRTVSLWLGRFKRSFNEIRQEIEQELHNDAILQDLKKTSEQVQQEANQVRDSLRSAAESLDDNGGNRIAPPSSKTHVAANRPTQPASDN